MRHKKDTTNENKPMITQQEAESLKNDLETLKDMAGAGEMGESGFSPTAQIDDIAVDKESLRRKIGILSRQLEAHKGQRVTDSAKRDKLYARRKELEEKFRDCIESWQDLGVIRRDSPDWAPAYKKAIERPRYEPYISEWKRIGLMLEPEDPFINSLDEFRK